MGIGKTQLTYAQGISADLVALTTILEPDRFGLLVSPRTCFRQVWRGSMTADVNGLQASTLRTIAIAWIFTLPAVALLSGGLFFLFSLFVK